MTTFAPLCAYAICIVMAWFYWKNELIQSILMILWIADTLTGIIRYYRMWNLKSRAIWYGITAKGLLLFIPFILHITAESVMIGSGDRITAIIYSALCVAETISIIQNIQIIKTGVEITEQDAMSKLLNGVLWLLNKFLENTLWKMQKMK